MLFNMPERKNEPFEKFTKSVVCPVCGRPDPEELHFDCRMTGRHLKCKADILGCEKCISVEYDLGEIAEILKED